MVELHMEEVVEEKDRKEVVVISRQGTCSSVLKIDDTGNPNYVTHYTAIGGFTIIPENESFGSAVQMVMKSILKENIENFYFLCDHLNSEWKNVAEEIRKTA